MRTMFTLNMEGLQLRLFQFQSLLAQLLPTLSAHLTSHSVHPAMYASQWFLTLFAYTYPMPLVLRIYDLVFAEGAPETIMRVAVALIRKNEEKILAINEFEDILDTLTAHLFDAFDGHPGRVINEAMGLSQVITKEKLDRLAEGYMKEVEAEKKACRGGPGRAVWVFRRQVEGPCQAALERAPFPARVHLYLTRRRQLAGS